MMEVLDDQPKGKQDYDVWISDGVALGKGKNQGKATSGQLFQFPYFFFIRLSIQRLAPMSVSIKLGHQY